MAAPQSQYDYFYSHTNESAYYDDSRQAPYIPRQQYIRASQGTTSSTVTSLSANYSTGTATTAMTQEPRYSKKIVVVGDGGCGKTCLLISYSKGVFPEKYVPTVFENYITEKLHKKSGEMVELALWDTAGQEEYDRLRPLSYPETDLLLVCFAIDCPSSLDNVLEKWYPEVTHFCPTTPLILVGLKTDLRDKANCINLLRTQGLTPVTPEQGRKVATKMDAVYFECSSKEQNGVTELFDLAIDLTIQPDMDRNMHAERTVSRFSGRSGGGGGKRKKRSCKIL